MTLSFHQRAKLIRLRKAYPHEHKALVRSHDEDTVFKTLLVHDIDVKITHTIRDSITPDVGTGIDSEELQLVMAVLGRSTGQVAKLCDKYQRSTTRLLLSTFDKAFETARKEKQDDGDKKR